MKKILLAGLATGLGLIAFAGSAYALPSVNYLPGTTNTTSGITTNATTGKDMAGMKVTAYFNNTNETKIWDSDGTDSGGVSGTGWSLKQSGDTMSNAWTFSGNGNMKSLTIDAGPGKTAFDVISSPEDTPGSSSGKAIVWAPNSTPWTISATYSGLVALSGSQPEGDLYRYLSIDFSNYTGGSADGTFLFLADTDTAAGNINPVPEPATMLLLGTGLAGIAGTMRRRKRNT